MYPAPIEAYFAPESLEETGTIRGASLQLAGISRGDYRPVVDSVFPLERVVEAHRYMASNQQVGKIVVATR